GSLHRPTNQKPEGGLMFYDELADVYPKLLRYARRVVRNGADAEDLVHDAIERGLLRRHLFRDGRLDYWIITILRHLFFDSCRRRQSWRGISAELAHRRDAEMDAEHGSIEPDAIDGASPRSYGTDDVRRAMEHLAPGLREVFSLFVFERLPQREIARR